MQDPASIDEQIASFHRTARANERHERNARLASRLVVAFIVIGFLSAIFLAGTGVGLLIGGLR